MFADLINAGSSTETMTLGQAAIYSVLGLAIVFVALFFLLVVIKILTKVIPAEKKPKDKTKKTKAEKAQKAAEAAPAATAPAAEAPEAPVTKAIPEATAPAAGEVVIENVAARDAACIMAIIADELKAQPDQLQFKSIKRA